MERLKEAVVLAGGEGRRLRTVLGDTPKFLAPVGGRPFADYLLNMLLSLGIERIILALGKGKEQIREYCTRFPLAGRLGFSEEAFPLGTGGALKRALLQAEGPVVLISNGDSVLVSEGLEPALERLAGGGFVLGLIGVRREDTGRFGRLELDESGKELRGFREKSVSGPGVINAGLYVARRTELLGLFPEEEVFSFEEWLEETVEEGRISVGVEVVSGYFLDIGVPEDYARAQKEWRRWTGGSPSPDHRS